MKRLLILSYHFRPLNVMASLRTNAFADYLHEVGIHPVVLTHDWAKEGNGVRTEVFESHTVIRLPHPETGKAYKPGPVKTLLELRKGHFDLGGYLPASRKMYLDFLQQHQPDQPYDGILGIYNPNHHLELGALFSKKWGIPFYADVRDLWTAHADTGQLEKGWKGRYREKLLKKYWKEWLAQAEGISTVSDHWARFLQEFTGRPCQTMRNGVEEGLFDGIERKAADVFTILHAGRLYPDQDLGVLFRGLQMFKETELPFHVHFMGADQEARERIESDALQHGLLDEVEISGRVSREEALQSMKNAHLLFYPAWEDHPGIIAGKVYEYMAAGIPVLVAPADEKSEAVRLITESGVGKGMNDGIAIAQWLEVLSESWVPSAPVEVSRRSEVLKFS